MAKANTPAELRGKTADELQSLLLELKREQFNSRFQRATGQNEGQSRIRDVRRTIARIKTLAHENLKKNTAGATAPAAKS